MGSFDKLITEGQYQQLVSFQDREVDAWLAGVQSGADSPFLLEKSIVEGLISILADCDFRRQLEGMVAAVDWGNEQIYYFRPTS